MWVGILRTFGCSALYDQISYSMGSNQCAAFGTWFHIKPLSYFCPRACGCRAGDPHCPTSCPKRNVTAPPCEDYQRSPFYYGRDPDGDARCPIAPAYLPGGPR